MRIKPNRIRRDTVVRRLVLASAIVCIPVAAFCGLSGSDEDYTPINASSGAVVPGEWNASVTAGKVYAEANNMPMLAIFGSKFCSHCHALQTACNTERFKAWVADMKPVMVFGMDENTKKFCKPDDSVSLPFVAIYWPKPDGSNVYVRFTGMMGYMPSKEGNTLEEQLINSCNKYFGAYSTLTGLEYIAFTNVYANARLEAEAGTTVYVDVPLARDAFLLGRFGTNVFTATYKGLPLVDKTIVWDADKVAMPVRVEIPAGVAPGDEIDLVLKSAEGEERSSTKIFVVDEAENSTKNPFFVGEKTADELGYGEWTMDLDVALEKYKANADSHIMAVASGSLWCPDCVMTDGHVLETEEFKKWAVDNKVILVDIDVPNFPNTTNSACLLTRVVGRTSDGYISGRGTLATNELERYQSGAGYLSRHMISDEAATKVLERNRSLVGRNTLNGGWNNPDRANQNRTGIPNFFALDRNGSLIGTFERFDVYGPTNSLSNAEYLRRFSELIATEEGGNFGDFSNRCWQTTGDSYDGSGTVSATLSSLDLIDVYQFTASKRAAELQTVAVSGLDATVEITVSLISVSDGEATTVDTVTGMLSQGVSVSGTMTPNEVYYLKIAASDKGTVAADSASASTVVSYEVTGSRQEIENPFHNEWIVKPMSTTLPLYSSDTKSLEGLLELSLKKKGKFTAKYSDGNRRKATFSSVWGADISADGTASATATKESYVLDIAISGSGVVSATVSDGSKTFFTGSCGLADDYAEFCGNYAVALLLEGISGKEVYPEGDAFMTISMANNGAAKKKGKIKYAVYLPDGKKLNGTTAVTVRDANFGVVPVLKTVGGNKFSASLFLRRNAAGALTRRAVIAANGVPIIWRGDGFVRECSAYGSLVVASDSLVAKSGVDKLAFAVDTENLADSSVYGPLVDVLYAGGGLSVGSSMIAPPEKVSGFKFKLKRKTGIFEGKTRLSFSGKDKVSASFRGVLMPDWFSDCECSDDDDKVVPQTFLPFGIGFCTFTDTVGGRRIKRSFPVGLVSSVDEERK